MVYKGNKRTHTYIATTRNTNDVGDNNDTFGCANDENNIGGDGVGGDEEEEDDGG